MTGLRGALAICVALSASACTALGPTPATTAITARPAARPEVDVQAAIAPGYFLSSSVVQDPQGSGMQQLSVVVEPDRWINLPGLIVGARAIGKSGDGQLEPVLGYRGTLGGSDSLALAAILFGTHSEGSADDASYEANRGGAEVAADLVLVRSHWLKLHGLASTSVHAVSADGDYCVNADGYGVQCPTNGDPPMRQTASASGVYGAAVVGLALTGGRDRDGLFHGVRIALMFAAGTMPRVLGGEQAAGTRYASAGLSLSFALGSER